MRNDIVRVNNVAKLWAAGGALQERPEGLPGIGVVFGRAGDGKSTALAHWCSCNEQPGLYTRALATWTPRGMLETICDELSIDTGTSNERTVRHIVEQLSRTPRPLVLDEADYIVNQQRLLETLRDLHDLSGVPIILVGMANFARRLAGRYAQFASRVAHWVEFQPATLDDAALLARSLAEVGIAEDLVVRAHRETDGSVRRFCVALSHIEKFAVARDLDVVDAATWGDRPLSFDGTASRLRGETEARVA